jgi:hypothetical protein
MPSTDAPNWWADVQQEREDLAGPGRRPADDWLGEDIDFVPRRRMARGSAAAAATAAERTTAEPVEHDADGVAHPLHGVFVPTSSHAPARQAAATSRTIELTTGDAAPRSSRRGAPTAQSPAARTIELTTDDGLVIATGADLAHELAHLSAADDPFATPPPPAGTRRTVQIKGRPSESRMPSMAQRHRGRTASDRVGARPDRIALWAVALGAILILLAAMTSSSQAAVAHRAAHAPAVSAHVAHVAHHAPLRAPLRHH